MMRRSTIQPQSMYHSPQRTVVVGFLYNILGSRVANLLESIPSRICGSHRAQAFEAAANVLTVRQVIDAVVRSMRSTVQYRVWIPRVQYGHVVNALRHFGGISQPWVQQSRSRAVQPTSLPTHENSIASNIRLCKEHARHEGRGPGALCDLLSITLIRPSNKRA